MAAEIYIKEVQSSPLNAVEATEVIEEGDLVTTDDGGYVSKADPAVDEVDGIVPNRQRGPHIREHVQDYAPIQYDAGDGPVPFYQLEDAMELRLAAGEEVETFEEVAFDADQHFVPADSDDAETDAVGTALGHAEVGDDLIVRVGL